MDEQEADRNSEPTAGHLPEGGLKEPHLLDLTDLLELAQWIALAVASGVIGNAAYDLLKNVKRRFGSSRVWEIKAKVLELIEEERTKSEFDQEKVIEQIDELFEEFE